jgi:hypothetical protein
MREREKTITLSPHRSQFHQHLRANFFLYARFDTFFGEQRLANGVHILANFGLILALLLFVGEIELQIFCQTPCAGNFLLGKKVW